MATETDKSAELERQLAELRGAETAASSEAGSERARLEADVKQHEAAEQALAAQAEAERADHALKLQELEERVAAAKTHEERALAEQHRQDLVSGQEQAAVTAASAAAEGRLGSARLHRSGVGGESKPAVGCHGITPSANDAICPHLLCVN